jgi:hypothetical protein
MRFVWKPACEQSRVRVFNWPRWLLLATAGALNFVACQRGALYHSGGLMQGLFEGIELNSS